MRHRGIYEKIPGSRVWWIRYVDAQGSFRREKAGTWSSARDLYHKRKTEALEGKKLPEKLRRPTVSFAEIVRDALEYSRRHKRSHRSDLCIFATLLDWFRSRAADSITAQQMEAKLNETAEERDWAASTYNHHRSALSLSYRLAKKNEKVTMNPARDVLHKREDNNRTRYLSRGENGEDERLTRAIREGWPEHLAEYIFAKNTGLRLGSQYGATYEMIDWERMELNIPRTKNEEPVHTPLNVEVLAALQSLPSWAERIGPIFRSQKHPDKPVKSNDHWFKPALKKAGISTFKWHDLRHTFASWLVQDGVPLERVSKLLGHKSLAMTMRYSHLAPNQLHEDVARLVGRPTGAVSGVPTDTTTDTGTPSAPRCETARVN